MRTPAALAALLVASAIQATMPSASAASSPSGRLASAARPLERVDLHHPATAPRMVAATPTAPLTLVSTSDTGVKGNDTSRFPAVSLDGMLVVFESYATNLDPADTDSYRDIYLKDLATGDLSLVSTSDAGVKGNSCSGDASISRDMTRVAFDSVATNLDPSDTDGIQDVYVKILGTGNIRLASTSTAGVKGNDDSTSPRLTGQGRKVAFGSSATNLDPLDADGFSDIYLKNLNGGVLTLVSTSSAGVKGNGSSLSPDMTSSGDRVAFWGSSTNLDPLDTDAIDDVYVKEVSTGDLLLASLTAASTKGNGDSWYPSISRAGSKVAFQSRATNLDPADTDTLTDVYVKDLDTGALTLVSASDTGVKGNGESSEPKISGNGKRVTFYSTATNLDPADTDPDMDVFVKDVTNGDIALVSSSTDGVNGNGASLWTAISGQGKRVAFTSEATNLDPGDTDAIQDVYVKVPTVCTLVGTAGNDFFLTGTTGDDVICGRAGDDTLEGLGGNDLMLGEDGSDVLIGDEGEDTLAGGTGDDFLVGGPDADSLDGESDIDTVTYSESPSAVTVDLAAGVGSGSNADGDAYTSIEGVVATAYADALTGDGGDNSLAAGGGDDVLTGGGGADVVDGSGGLDVAVYAASPAGITADLSTQTITGGDATGDAISGIEEVIGTAFDDTLIGDAGTNAFMGMAGADSMDGAGGADDVVAYLYSPAAVTVDLATQTASGGHATGDTLAGFEGAMGSPFGDTLGGTTASNLLLGEVGNDTMFGLDGDDVLVGEDGVDTFYAGVGTDSCDNVVGEVASSCELRSVVGPV